jgi:hypothetical protein
MAHDLAALIQAVNALRMETRRMIRRSIEWRPCYEQGSVSWMIKPSD